MNNKEIEKIQKMTEKDEEYTKLECELALIQIISEKNELADEKKKQEILSKRKKLFKNDPEMDGVNLSIEVKNNALEHEAQKYCAHEFDTNIYRSLTRNLLKTITREVRCRNCSFEQIDTITEEPSKEQLEEWMWR